MKLPLWKKKLTYSEPCSILELLLWFVLTKIICICENTCLGLRFKSNKEKAFT